MSSRKCIEFNLLGNAQDSLRQAIRQLAWNDAGSPQSQLKHAVVNTAHCVELLLKERLRRIHPAFLWEKVEKYPSLTAHTVTAECAILRLKSVGSVAFLAHDEKILKDLRTARNAIEHYEWSTTRKEARQIVGDALNFVFTFGRAELGVDLASEFRSDDTWRTFLDELYEFTNAYRKQLQETMRKRGDDPVECRNCGEDAVPWLGGTCEVCGHWQDLESED